MKKKMFFTITSLVFTGIFFFVTSDVSEAAKVVPLKNTWNQNIFTGAKTNWRSYTQVVPDNQYVRYTTTDSFNGGGITDNILHSSTFGKRDIYGFR